METDKSYVVSVVKLLCNSSFVYKTIHLTHTDKPHSGYCARCQDYSNMVSVKELKVYNLGNFKMQFYSNYMEF